MSKKKLISFSLWGDNPLYCDGILRNVTARDEHYPGWVIRVYHDGSVPKSVLLQLQYAAGVECVEMPPALGALAMFWRFRPMDDTGTVARFIVRDADSTVGPREAAAVQEWIESGQPFHVIRDCESHNIPILGGTWGAVTGCIADFGYRIGAYLSTVRPDPRNPRGEYHNADQLFLHDVVWPYVYNKHIAHVRAECAGLRLMGNEIDLPAWHEGERYVGMVG